MAQSEQKPKRKAAGTPVLTMHNRIDASPEEIADVMFRRPPKTEWSYLKRKQG